MLDQPEHNQIYAFRLSLLIMNPFFFLLLLLLLLLLASASSPSPTTFGFDIHHRYSEPVKRVLGSNGLPEMGSPEYYWALVHRDRLIWDRHLAVKLPTPVTFAGGNHTVEIDDLGYLHHANVSIGTPSVSFMVALDTGSDLFWLPCHFRKWSSEHQIDVKLYYANASSTSKVVSCESPSCPAQWFCTPHYECSYDVRYLSKDSSTTGMYLDEVLHLTTENSHQTVDAPIKLGCGLIQTGGLLSGGPVNGLFGLGMGNISVPSILANQGIISNSYSMCFGKDGFGRIDFGDKGSLDQAKTPFTVDPTLPTYNISLTHIALDDNSTKISMTALFDSGTSFTHLKDPAYSAIVEKFNSRIKQPRYTSDPELPFEYCYDLSATQTIVDSLVMKLTMEGGRQLSIKKPFEIYETSVDRYAYCLGIFKTENINIIGQNFMTGYRIVFDREEMVLGWKISDCNEAVHSRNRSTRARSPPPPTVMPEKSMAPKNLNSFTPEFLIFAFAWSLVFIWQSNSLNLIMSLLTHFVQ